VNVSQRVGPSENYISVWRGEDRSSDDRIDEMLDAIWPKLETNPEDPPTSEVQKFFDMLRDSEELLHEHTTVSVIAFVIRLTSIKSKFTFLNKYYKELLSLFSDVLPSNHKMSKDMYQSKKLLSALGMEYKKIGACEENYIISTKSTRMRQNA
jgi:hypothetical protein